MPPSIRSRSNIFRAGGGSSVAGAHRPNRMYQGRGPRNDPSPRKALTGIFLFRCSFCQRIQEQPRRYYHYTCCHPYEMKFVGTKASAIGAQEMLMRNEKVFDFDEMKPKYGKTRPTPRGRITYVKK
eukprot:PhM_4_TR14824/c0_g1_i1/m.62897